MQKTLRNARLSVASAFVINGLLMATWVSRIPDIQAELGLSEGALGFVLLGLSVGVLLGLSITGGLIARFGSAKTTLYSALAYSASLVILAFMPNPVTLWLSLLLFGVVMSIMDVAMNDMAVVVEKQYQHPLMSSFHATFSVGGLAGAVLGSFMTGTLSFSPWLHFLVVAVLFSGLTLLISRHFPPSEVDPTKKAPVFSLPERALWLLGIVAFCSSVGEGAMADWSAVYLNKALNTSTSYAALGFAAFSLTMTIFRFAGDYLTSRFKPQVVVRFGGMLATIGLLVIIFVTQPVIALIGFAIVGIGLANIIPVVFSAAGNSKDVSAGAGIAGVATIGYAGFLAGPPVIGLLAEAFSLQAAFGLVAIMTASLIFTARAIKN